MLLSIIIVNYNVKYFLEHCLLSVLKATQGIEAEILVVDNNSTDGSQAYFANKFTTVSFFWNPTNVGFAKANNQAIKVAMGSYILFLNPDTLVGQSCFTNCLSLLQERPNIGAVGVRMVNGSGQFLRESKRGVPTPINSLFKLTGLANAFTKIAFFTSYYAGHVAECDTGKVAVLAGAFMMLSRKALQATRGFDEQFFMYGEDIDLSYRITQAGLENYYLGSTTIIHFKGESTQKKTATYYQHFYGAMQLFVQKHYQRHKVKAAAMGLSIKLAKALKTTVGAGKQPSNHTKINKVAIVGTIEEIDLLHKFFTTIQTLTYPLQIQHKSYNAKAIVSFVTKHKSDAVVLCQGQIAIDDVILLLDLLPDTAIYFYQLSAGSIIGSTDKNTQGHIIPIEL